MGRAKMVQFINQIKTTYRFQKNGIFSFSPKIHFQFEVGSYTVKTITVFKELIECFQLRDEVFNKEFRSVYDCKYDFDEFDAQCDHIIIIHNSTAKIVGTYRLNSSLHSRNFYTTQEFDLDIFKQTQDSILELGRACIQKEHRRGAVITLLWKGIAEYMNRSKSKLLIGCSSVKISSAREAALIYRYLDKNGLIEMNYNSKPLPQYQMPSFSAWLDYFNRCYTEAYEEEVMSLLPSLLKSYLKLGAKVIGEPAYDQEFDCVDFLTLLQRDQLSKSVEKKYGLTMAL